MGRKRRSWYRSTIKEAIIAERIRITGKNDGVNDNEAIDAQVDSTFNAVHVKSHLYAYDGIGFTVPMRGVTNPNTGNNELLVNLQGHKCEDNSTTTPILANATFTGTSWQDTLDYGVVSVDVVSDQNSAADGLVVQWSYDGTTVNNTDSFTILANTPKTFTFGPANRYIRVVYTNGTTDQTTFSVQTLLRKVYVKPSSHRINDAIVGQDDAELIKAVLTGVNPDGVFENIETTYGNSLKTSLIDGETGSRAEVEPLGALKVESPVRLVGTTFSNSTKDPNFWTDNSTLSGTVTQSGQIIMATGTTANATAVYTTVRKARKITGTANQFRCIAGLTTDAQANNIRRIGAYSTTDGFFFQANGTTMQVASRKASSDTTISSGSFNGNYGTTWSPETNTLYRLVIEYTASSARFFVNGKLLHTISNTTTGTTNTLTLPVTIENINSGGNTTNNTFVVQFATILRLGELETNSQYYHISGNAATHVLKYNAGVLQKIMFNNVSGTSLTIYDNTEASGNIIGIITTTSNCIGEWEYNVPFSNGLTLVTVGNSLDATIIYE